MNKMIRKFVDTRKTLESALGVINKVDSLRMLDAHRIHTGKEMLELGVSLMAAFTDSVERSGISSRPEALYNEMEFLGVSLARTAISALKNGGTMNVEISNALYAGEVSPLFPYVRYGTVQGAYQHLYVSAKKEEELSDLDIGEFDSITAREVITLVDGNTILFVEDKFAVGIERRTGEWLESKEHPDVGRDSVKLWVIPHKNNIELLRLLPGAKTAEERRHGGRELLFDQGVFFTLSERLRSVVINGEDEGGGLSLLEEDANDISGLLTGKYRGEFAGPLKAILPLVLRVLLYTKSKNVGLPTATPISRRADEIRAALDGCSDRKRKELLRELTNMRVSAHLVDLDNTTVDVPKSKSEGTKEGVAMHVRRGHFHKVRYGTRSIPLEDRPYRVLYFPRIVVGNKTPKSIKVDVL